MYFFKKSFVKFNLISRSLHSYEKLRYEVLTEFSPNFIGKRSLGSEFLGKRALGSEFLGKRALGSEFLGKRGLGSEFLGKRGLGSEFLGKRGLGSEFLGKRTLGSEFLGKRSSTPVQHDVIADDSLNYNNQWNPPSPLLQQRKCCLLGSSKK